MGLETPLHIKTKVPAATLFQTITSDIAPNISGLVKSARSGKDVQLLVTSVVRTLTEFIGVTVEPNVGSTRKSATVTVRNVEIYANRHSVVITVMWNATVIAFFPKLLKLERH